MTYEQLFAQHKLMLGEDGFISEQEDDLTVVVLWASSVTIAVAIAMAYHAPGVVTAFKSEQSLASGDRDARYEFTVKS